MQPSLTQRPVYTINENSCHTTPCAQSKGQSCVICMYGVVRHGATQNKLFVLTDDLSLKYVGYNLMPSCQVRPVSYSEINEILCQHVQGCQICPGTAHQIINKYTKRHIKYTKLPQHAPNGHKIYQHLPLQDPPKFNQIGILGLKKYHLATLNMSTKCCIYKM
jgi:hypothetical protein